MKLSLVELLLFLQITKQVKSYDLVCPCTTQWNLRASAICLQRDSYTCLLNRTYEKYNENCQGPDIADRGHKLVFQPIDFNLAKCRNERYQPIAFSSNGNSQCLFQKSTCSEEGQVVCKDTSLDADVKCRCDYTKGYKFVSNTTNPCVCIPSNEDCSCFWSDNITDVVFPSCGSYQNVCIGLTSTISGIQTNFSYADQHNTNSSSTYYIRDNILLRPFITLTLIGIITFAIVYVVFVRHLHGYYTNQFKIAIEADKTHLCTQDDMAEDEGHETKLIIASLELGEDIKDRSNQEAAGIKLNDESDRNKCAYQVYEDDPVTVQWNKDESGSEHQSNQDSDNKKPIGESNDSKLQKQASGETNVTVRWDKDDSRSVHQSNQDSDKEKQVGESVESSLQNQVSEEKNDAGFQLKEDNIDIKILSDQERDDKNHIEEIDKINYQYEMSAEDHVTGSFIDHTNKEIEAGKTSMYSEDKNKETQYMSESPETPHITGSLIDHTNKEIEAVKTNLHSQDDNTETKYLSISPETQHITALVQGCNEDKPDNEHQSYPDSDGGLHIDKNVEGKCQYQVSRKGHVTGCLSDEGKNENDADITDLQTKFGGAANYTMDKWPGSEHSTGQLQHNTQSNSVINFKQPDLFGECSLQPDRKVSNDDFNITEMVNEQCLMTKLPETDDGNKDVFVNKKIRNRNEIMDKGDKGMNEEIPVKPSNQGKEDKRTKKQNTLEELIRSLGLDNFFPNKITLMDVMVVNNPLESVTFTDIPWIVFKSLVTGNFNSRDKMVQELLEKTEEANQTTKLSVSDNSDDMFEILLDEASRSMSLNPMDLLVVLFHCSSPILKQVLAQKLFMCKLAIPICLPSLGFDKVLFSTWMLQTIVLDLPTEKELLMEDEKMLYHSDITNSPTHFVGFMRLGKISISKSKIINDVLTDQPHNTFFNIDCPMGTSVRTVSDGTIESAWFLPSELSDFSNDVIMCMNLRGDGLKHVDQVNIIATVSAVVVVMLDVKCLNDTTTINALNELHKSVNGVIIAIDGNSVGLNQLKDICKDYVSHITNFMKKTEFCFMSKEGRATSFSDIKKSIRKSITKLTADMKPCTLSQLSNDGYTEAEIDNKYQQCKEKAECIMCHIPGNHSDVKDDIVPLQGETWRNWSKCCKTLNKTGQYTSIRDADKIKQQMIELRKKEMDVCTKLGLFMTSFIEAIFEYLDNDLHFTFFVWWLKLLLDDRSRRILPKYLTEYQRDWEALRLVKNNKQHDRIDIIRLDLNKSEYNLAEASFGLEHLVREIGQIYEAMIECKKETIRSTSMGSITVSKLATFGAKLLLNGQPFEIMDGDAANVPLIWVKAVLSKLQTMIGDKKLLALSIIGVQSSGKSTLLNTMFGFQFAVSAGRCTRGVYMQLVKVGKCSVPVDYIVVFDTEGLRAPELANQKYSHDNELATFVIGLGDITIVNIKGENTAEVKDVLQIAVHAFLRLKLANSRLNLKQNCIFVHQNVPASDANNKMMQGRQKFLESLDEMTKEAADQENIAGIHSFSQVIDFDCNKDVWYLSDLWNGDPPMAPINPGYSKRVDEVRNAILYNLASVRQTYFTITNTIVRIDDLWTGILKDDFVFSFRNSLELKAYNSIERKYQELTWKLEKSVSEFVLLKAKSEMYKCVNDEDFNNAVPKIVTLCSQKIGLQVLDLSNELNVFVDTNPLKDIMTQWKQNKQKRLKMLSEDLIDRSKASIKKTKEEIRIEKLRMSAQKTHEMEINKRAQVLANDMRGEKPTDDVLKDKFNCMWETWMTSFQAEIVEDRVSIKDEIESLIWEKFSADAAFLECQAYDSESNTRLILADEYVLTKDYIKSALEKKYGQFQALKMVQISDGQFQIFNGLIQLESSMNTIQIADDHIQIKRSWLWKEKENRTICKRQTESFTRELLRKIDNFLFNLKDRNMKSDVKQAEEIITLIQHHIEHETPNHFDLTDQYVIMVTAHIMRYAIIWFTKLNVTYRRIQKFQSEDQTVLGNQSILRNAVLGTYKKPKPNEKLVKLKGSIKSSDILANHISMKKSYEEENWKIYTDLRNDAVEVTDKILDKIDTRLAEYNSQDVRFEISYATEILMLISNHIDAHNNHMVNTYRFNLLPPYRAMIVTHVLPFIIHFFVSINDRYNKKHSPKCQMEEYRGTVWTLFKDVFNSKAESVIAATFFRKAITKAVTEHLDNHLPILVHEHIMTTFAHEKYALMKTIMTKLAEEENVNNFIKYIKDPSEYTRVWLNCYINREIFDRKEGFCTIYGRLAKSQITDLLKQVSKCISEASCFCRDSDVKDMSSWIKSFIQKSRELTELPFPIEVFVHVQNRSVEDLESYIEVVNKYFNEMENDIFRPYHETDEQTVQWKQNPISKIMETLWGCTAKCMFCAEPCRHTDKSHVTDDVLHQCIQHRPKGLNGFHKSETRCLSINFCNFSVQTNNMYRMSLDGKREKKYYKEYKTHFPEWDIVPSSDKSKYWMWVMNKYQDQLADKHKAELSNLPKTWETITKEEAIDSLSFA